MLFAADMLLIGFWRAFAVTCLSVCYSAAGSQYLSLLLFVGFLVSVFSLWCLLVVGCWLLVVGCCWLLVVAGLCCLTQTFCNHPPRD